MDRKKFIQKLKHAFAIDSGEDFTQEEILILDKIAEGVVKRRLTAPAVIFLESFKPMNFIGSQAIQFFLPIVECVLTSKTLEKLPQIFEKRKSVELLLAKIEENERRYNETAKKEKKKN